MCTNAITLTSHKCKVWLMNYLDDYIGVASGSQAESHFLTLSNILQYVGLPINQKIEIPSGSINCLGISINAETGVLKLPEEKNRKKSVFGVKHDSHKNSMPKVGKKTYLYLLLC